MNAHSLFFVVSIACMNSMGADKAPEITDLGFGTEWLAVNEKGQIAFTATDSNNMGRQAVLWERGARTNLGFLPGDTASWAADLNKRGQVVGWSTGTCDRAFVWQEGVMTPLGGCSTWAAGINDRGEIVGSYYTSSTSHGAAMWQEGKMIDLGVPPSNFGSAARAINEHGQIVGQYGVNGVSHPFLWDNTHVTDLGLLPGAYACGATSINNHGQVVGWCFVSGFLRGFLWHKGTMTALDHPAGILGSFAGKINDHGEIAGYAYGSEFQARAVMWKNGTLIDLTTVIAPSAWRLLSAYDINDHGQVVGLGDVSIPPADYAFQGFLLDIH